MSNHVKRKKGRTFKQFQGDIGVVLVKNPLTVKFNDTYRKYKRKLDET